VEHFFTKEVKGLHAAYAEAVDTSWLIYRKLLNRMYDKIRLSVAQKTARCAVASLRRLREIIFAFLDLPIAPLREIKLLLPWKLLQHFGDVEFCGFFRCHFHRFGALALDHASPDNFF